MANPSKTLVEHCFSIDIKQFKDLDNGIFFCKTASLPIIFTKKNHVLSLNNQQFIQFSHQKVGYGERLMFLCPVCYEARRKLFTKSNVFYFACQKCHGLVYRTSRLSGNELEYIDNQIMKIQRQFDMAHYYDFGGAGSYIEFIPLHKPKYMRWAKYDELISELKRLIKCRIEVWLSSIKL